MLFFPKLGPTFVSRHLFALCAPLVACGCDPSVEHSGQADAGLDAGDDSTETHEASSSTSGTASTSSSEQRETSQTRIDTEATGASGGDSGEQSDSMSWGNTRDGDAATGAGSVSNRSEGAVDSGLPPEQACVSLSKAPSVAVILSDLFTANDFAFDSNGNHVASTWGNMLMRTSLAGGVKKWGPQLGDVSGIAMLADGSAVVSVASDTSGGQVLKRVYPDGTARVILANLEGPSGVTVGSDGNVYLAETLSGRVLRVNPDTGDFTIAAMGLDTPSRLVFAPGEHVLYVSSFRGSGIYEVTFSEPGALGQVRVFARALGATLEGPTLACPDAVVGAVCSLDTETVGACRDVHGVVDCFSPVVAGPCDDVPLGTECSTEWGAAGNCVDPEGDGTAFCEHREPCTGLSAGDECTTAYEERAGTCTGYEGYLVCEVDPCKGAAVGDDCSYPYFGQSGKCAQSSYGEDLVCRLPQPCDGSGIGDVCESGGLTGICAQLGADDLFCDIPPCSGSAAGDECYTRDSVFGVCESSDGGLECRPGEPKPSQSDAGASTEPTPASACQGKEVGQSCGEGASAGTCHWHAPYGPSYRQLTCFPAACGEVEQGSLCSLESGGLGQCNEGACAALPGAVDALEVDTCGNVYYTDYLQGNLWQVSSGGQSNLVTTFESGWLPAMHWGTGAGGFERDVLYIFDAEQGRLLAVESANGAM